MSDGKMTITQYEDPSQGDSYVGIRMDWPSLAMKAALGAVGFSRGTGPEAKGAALAGAKQALEGALAQVNAMMDE